MFGISTFGPVLAHAAEVSDEPERKATLPATPAAAPGGAPLYSGPIAGTAAAEAQRLSSGSALGALGNRGGTAADAGGEGALGSSLRAMKE